MSSTTTYRGSCHCGAVRFRFQSAPIASGRRCNCSICIRRGAVMSPGTIPPDDFFEMVGLESLTLYRFGERTVNHWFCRHCGTYPFHEAVARPGRYRVNLGCLEDFDPLALEVTLIDGKNF